VPPLHRIVLARLRGLFRRDAVSQEIHDELEFHVQMRAEQYARQGASPDDAKRRAARRVGNLALLQDRGYDIRGGGVMETILQDVKYSLRLLRRQPVFTALALATMAVGIGLSTALFSVIDAALLRPLPYPNPDQLVHIRIETRFKGDSKPHTQNPSHVETSEWQRTNRTLSSLGVVKQGFVRLVGDAGGGPERIGLNYLSAGGLETYGIAPVLGRAFSTEDTARGAPRVALLGHGYWQSRFAGKADVLGRAIRFADGSASIIGVLPAGFYRGTDVWQPLTVPAKIDVRECCIEVIGRLRPGVSLQQAERDLSDLLSRISTTRTEPVADKAQLTSLRSEKTKRSESTIAILASAVGFILLIACVNVGGLLLARGATRQPELAIRASIGAGRFRLIRQLLTESLVLAVGGGLAGAILAWLSLDSLLAVIPVSVPADSAATVNLQVLAFALVLSVLTSTAFGLIPALTLSRARIGLGVGGGSRRHGSALSRRGGQLIVGIEVALAIVLLVGAGLMVRSFARAISVDVGFDPGAILAIEVAPVNQTPEVMTAYYPALLDAIRAIPGVAAAGTIDYVPMGRTTRFSSGPPGSALGSLGQTAMRQPRAGYLEALGQPMKAGRIPTASEIAATPLAALNEEAARRLFPGGTAVGQFITIGGAPREVVAVVGNLRHSGPLQPMHSEALLFASGPITQPLNVVVRPARGAEVSVEQLRRAAVSIGPEVFFERVRRGSDLVGDYIATPRHNTWLFGLLGGLGLVLTLVGIFGITAYAVEQRTREIGVRMAFGARSAQVVRMIVGDAAWPVAIGIAIGLGGAAFSTKVIATFLFETTPTDTVTFASVAALLGIAAGLAAWLPARRAARVDPVTALRAE
jgi:putative ABC transport system permease protein